MSNRPALLTGGVAAVVDRNSTASGALRAQLDVVIHPLFLALWGGDAELVEPRRTSSSFLQRAERPARSRRRGPSAAFSPTTMKSGRSHRSGHCRSASVAIRRIALGPRTGSGYLAGAAVVLTRGCFARFPG